MYGPTDRENMELEPGLHATPAPFPATLAEGIQGFSHQHKQKANDPNHVSKETSGIRNSPVQVNDEGINPRNNDDSHDGKPELFVLESIPHSLLQPRHLFDLIQKSITDSPSSALECNNLSLMGDISSWLLIISRNGRAIFWSPITNAPSKVFSPTMSRSWLTLVPLSLAMVFGNCSQVSLEPRVA
jgi:hypothetical protein